jgi:hypothetical protein
MAFGEVSPDEVRLTDNERATLSNTICGDMESARSLERMGFVRIDKVTSTARGQLAFFDLTEAGEAYVTHHFTVADPSDQGDVGLR